jgi:hypothetical protein
MVKMLGHLERLEEGRTSRMIFTQEIWGDETKGKTQERMERSRKRSSSAGSEKMERVSD